MFPVFARMCVYLFSLTWCLPSLAAKACQLLRRQNKKRGDRMCVCVLVRLCVRGVVLQAASPWDRARWSPQAKQVGPVYLLHSGSRQLRFRLIRGTDQASVPKNKAFTHLHPLPTLLHLIVFTEIRLLQMLFLEGWDLTLSLSLWLRNICSHRYGVFVFFFFTFLSKIRIVGAKFEFEVVLERKRCQTVFSL